MMWKAVAVAAIWICAAAGYFRRDGSDPWICAVLGTLAMLEFWR